MDQNNQTEHRLQTMKSVYTSSRESSDATPLDEKFTNFTAYTVITYLNYDIYAKGYIVFIFPLILCPLESLFIR